MIGACMMFGMLTVCTIEDLKCRKIYIIPVILCGLAGMIMHLFCREISIYNILAGMLIGLLMLLLAKLSGGAIGTGDGIVLIVTGIFLGGWKNLSLLLLALVFSAVLSLLLLLLRKKKKTDSIPFIPCLLLAYLVVYLLCTV